MDLGLYFKKRKVEAEGSASMLASRKEVTERTYVEIQEEEGRQEETVEFGRRGWRCQTDGDSGYSGRWK